MGAGADGYRRLPGSGAIDAEPHAGRPAFSRSLGERGADGVACVASDAHEGPRRAVEEALPGAAWRRRTVRLVGNAASLAPARQKRAAALAIPHAAFAERDPSPVRGLCRLACRGICSLRPKAAELLEEAEADALAYLDLPCARHRRLRASNDQKVAHGRVDRPGPCSGEANRSCACVRRDCRGARKARHRCRGCRQPDRREGCLDDGLEYEPDSR